MLNGGYFAKLTYSRLLQLIESIFYPFQLNYNFLNIRIEPALDFFVEMTAVLPNELLISQQARDLGNQLIKEMISFVKENDIDEIQDLIDYAMENRFDDWFPLLADNGTFAINTFIKSRRHRMKDKD